MVHNDANGGWTTADVADDLGSAPTRAHLAGADLVLVEVGANDFNLDRVDDRACFPAAGSACWSSTVAGLRDGLTRVIQAIRGIDHRPDLRIALLGYWNITVDGSVGRALGENFVLGSDELTRLVNETVQQVATTTGVRLRRRVQPLKGPTGTRDPTDDLLVRRRPPERRRTRPARLGRGGRAPRDGSGDGLDDGALRATADANQAYSAGGFSLVPPWVGATT